MASNDSMFSSFETDPVLGDYQVGDPTFPAYYTIGTPSVEVESVDPELMIFLDEPIPKPNGELLFFATGGSLPPHADIFEAYNRRGIAGVKDIAKKHGMTVCGE